MIELGATAEAVQAKIDSLPRYVPVGTTLTFQFAPNRFIFNDALRWRGFFGGGEILIQGDPTEPNSVHLNQATILDFSSDPVDGVVSYANDVGVTIMNLRIIIQDDPNKHRGILVRRTKYAVVRGNYVAANGTSDAIGIQVDAGSVADVFSNYVDNCEIALVAGSATLNSNTNESSATGNATSPVYGAWASAGGIISLFGSTPAGALHKERGGFVRFHGRPSEAVTAAAIAICRGHDINANGNIDIEPLEPAGWPNGDTMTGDGACARTIGRPAAGRSCQAVYAVYIGDGGGYHEVNQVSCMQPTAITEHNKYFACCER